MKYSNPAGLGKRIAATLLDGVLLSVIAWLAVKIFGVSGGHSNAFEQTLKFLYFLLLPLFWYGYTLGKRFLSIRMAKPDGSNIAVLNALLRTIGNIVYVIPVGVGIFASFGSDFSSYGARLNELASNGSGVPASIAVGVLGTLALLALSVFMIAYRDDARSIHDFIGGTYVTTDKPSSSK